MGVLQYYYNRPSPIDVLHEEQEYQLNNSYCGKCIYEWNIDGYTDKQIYNQIHRMLMYSTICKSSGNTYVNIAKMIVAGFTGQLIGRYSDNRDNLRTLLQNLWCKTLTDFRWYKDTFLSRVMELPESNSTCTQEGLNLCNEIKLNQQLKRQNLVERNNLGEFCNQFGMDVPASSHKKNKHFNNSYNTYKKGKKKYYSKDKLYKKVDRKALTKTYKKNKKPDRLIVCYKCNKVGHFAKHCSTKNKIASLDIDNERKDKLYKIFLVSDEELEESSSSSDNEVKILDNDSYLFESESSEWEPV
ncbi:uncharacterized protein LOC141631852 [Silene latifolia]|uniref:uncharacterized protein LOC141631852 n=1 Tax=Silene latifolia TaxID=37657 RepID=UPI003D771FB6